MIEKLSDGLQVNWRLIFNNAATKSLKPKLNMPPRWLESSKFHYAWLRDNCQCQQCLHPSSRQKLHSSADIPHDIHPKDAVFDKQSNQLHLTWNDGSHKSVFSTDWLLQNDYSPESIKQRQANDNKMIFWDNARLKGALKDVSYKDYMDLKSQGLQTALQNLQLYGLTFITGCPAKEKTDNTKEKTDNKTVVELIAERIGPIYDTFYGRMFDVKSVPDAKNIAYTSLHLGLHMDLMYFESPPGLQLLHCLESSVEGGESIFVDSYKAAEILQRDHPESFETLCRVPVTFHYQNNGHSLRFKRPTISTDPLSQLGAYQIYYAPPFQGPLEVKHEDLGAFYRSFKHFEDILNDRSLLHQRRLEAGELVIFANRRVLHGRLSFNANSGRRHLQGTYVAWDSFKDRVRTTIEGSQ